MWIKQLRGLFRAKRVSDREPQWSIARLVNKPAGEGGVVRYMTERTPDHDRLTCAIEITWAYAESGLPSPEQNEDMNGFERAIDPLTEDGGESQMVYVRTGFGQKEWLFYSRDRDAFMKAFNLRLTGRPRYPLEIRFCDDPEWELWRDFVETIAESQEAAPNQRL